MAGTKYVFQNQTTDGASDSVVLNYDNVVLAQGFGTWGGATIVLQTLAPDNTTWISVPDLTGSAITMVADSQFSISDFVQNQSFRAVLSGASGSTNLTLTIQDV